MQYAQKFDGSGATEGAGPIRNTDRSTYATSLLIPRSNRIAFFQYPTQVDASTWRWRSPPYPFRRKGVVSVAHEGQFGRWQQRQNDRHRHCRKCSVSLCLSIPSNFRRSCWLLWYTEQTIISRLVRTATPRALYASGAGSAPDATSTVERSRGVAESAAINLAEVINFAHLRAPSTQRRSTSKSRKSAEEQRPLSDGTGKLGCREQHDNDGEAHARLSVHHCCRSNTSQVQRSASSISRQKMTHLGNYFRPKQSDQPAICLVCKAILAGTNLTRLALPMSWHRRGVYSGSQCTGAAT